MRFTRENGGIVGVSATAASTLMSLAQNGEDAPESGGILIGRLIVDTEDVVIDEVTVPTSSDRWGRFRFWRAKRPAQRRVDRAWNESGGTENYLGDWHTHPEDDPAPSGMDIENWQQIVRTAQFHQDFLFFLIVGRSRTRAWELSKSTGVLRELKGLN